MAGLAYSVVACVGVTRSYQYDEAVTVGFFVQPRDFVDAVTAQINFNNHHLLTAVDWLLYRAGGTTEAWMRAAPIAAGGATVAVLAWWCARRWGQTPAILAAAFMILNPMYLDLTRQARGYAFAGLGVLLSTLVIVDRSRDLDQPKVRATYAILVAACLLSHLFSGLAIIGHGAHLLWHQRGSMRPWVVATALGGLVAAPIYALNLRDMVDTTGAARPFDELFVLRLTAEMFGGFAIGLVGCLGLAALVVDNRRSILPAMIAVSVPATVVWLVIRPSTFEPRFFLWLVPLVAVVGARSLHHHPKAAVPALVIVLALAPSMHRVTKWYPSNRAVAQMGHELNESGEQVCTADYYWEEYYVYGDFPQVASTRGCTLVIVRRTDLENRTVAGLSFAEIPAVDDVCLAGDELTLERQGLESASCD